MIYAHPPPWNMCAKVSKNGSFFITDPSVGFQFYKRIYFVQPHLLFLNANPLSDQSNCGFHDRGYPSTMSTKIEHYPMQPRLSSPLKDRPP